MVHPAWTQVMNSHESIGPDDDLAKTLNLIYPYETEVFSYPLATFPEDTGMRKPKVIYIGDSFLESWINDGLMAHCNADWQVWSHFSQVWDKDHTPATPPLFIHDYDWLNAIKHTDCIVLMYTSFNLPEFGDGFIEKAYDHFYPAK